MTPLPYLRIISLGWLSFFLAFPFLLLGQAEDKGAQNGKGAVIIVALEGDVKAKKSAAPEGQFLPQGEVAVGKTIPEKHTLLTAEASKAVLLFTNGSMVTVGASSKFAVQEFTQSAFQDTGQKVSELQAEPSTSKTKLELAYGDMVFDVKKLNAGSSFEIDSPVGSAGIRGTVGQLEVEVDPITGTMSGGVNMVEGNVNYTDPSGVSVNVNAGQSTTTSVTSTGQQIGLTTQADVPADTAAEINSTTQSSQDSASNVTTSDISNAAQQATTEATNNEGNSNDSSNDGTPSDQPDSDSGDSGVDSAALEQAVDAALSAASNDAFSIEVALQKVLTENTPSVEVMKVVASAAMRKVASYNDASLMEKVSAGMVKASMSQAVQYGVDAEKVVQAVSEGLVSTAMEVISRKGGNSLATSSSVAKAALSTAIQMAQQLTIPEANVSNAAAFGAMTGAIESSADFGQDLGTTATEISSGITEGVIEGSTSAGVDAAPIVQASLTGSVDSIEVIAQETSIPAPETIVESVQQGQVQGLVVAASSVQSIAQSTAEASTGTTETTDSTETTTTTTQSASDVTGSGSIPKTVLTRNPETGLVEAVLENAGTLSPDIQFVLYKNGTQVGEASGTSAFSLGASATEANVGIYSIAILDPNSNQTTLSLPTTFALQNSQLPPSSPSN